MVVFDPSTQQYVNVPNPLRIRVPFLNREVPAGDAVAAATQAIGIQPCAPCEERQKKLNQRVVFSPWGT
jgi:hypothetical protein